MKQRNWTRHGAGARGLPSARRRSRPWQRMAGTITAGLWSKREYDPLGADAEGCPKLRAPPPTGRRERSTSGARPRCGSDVRSAYTTQDLNLERELHGPVSKLQILGFQTF